MMKNNKMIVKVKSKMTAIAQDMRDTALPNGLAAIN